MKKKQQIAPAAERLSTAIGGGMPDRVPVVPKIWVDLAGALTGTPLTEVVSRPLIALRVIADAGAICRADAIRQFHFPARKIRPKDSRIYEVDENDEIVGEIDIAGGLGTHLIDPGRFKLSDPRYTAYYQYWTADAPFINDISDAKRITVPEKSFYIENRCAERQMTVAAEIDDGLSIIGDCSSATMAFLVSMRGMGRAAMDLLDEPMLVHATMEKGVSIAIEKGKFNIDLGITILRLNDSVGNMNVISPAHWREFVYPHMKDICDALHSYNPATQIYCHICGNILPIAEDLAKTGLDCIGPLDPLGGFTPEQIRKRVGNEVSLMGGVNTMSFVDKLPDQIEEEAVACIRQAGQKGGYILGSGCVIPRGATKKSILALRNAAEKYGRYDANGLAPPVNADS